MKFEGDQDLDHKPEFLWEKLSNAAFLAECLPDASVEGQPTQQEADCSVRPGFSFIRGSLDVHVKILEAVKPTLTKIGLVSKGIGSGSDVEATLQFAPTDKGTRVHWLAEIKSMSGLMKMIPAGLIKGAAQQVIQNLLNNVRQKLASGT